MKNHTQNFDVKSKSQTNSNIVLVSCEAHGIEGQIKLELN